MQLLAGFLAFSNVVLAATNSSFVWGYSPRVLPAPNPIVSPYFSMFNCTFPYQPANQQYVLFQTCTGLTAIVQLQQQQFPTGNSPVGALPNSIAFLFQGNVFNVSNILGQSLLQNNLGALSIQTNMNGYQISGSLGALNPTGLFSPGLQLNNLTGSHGLAPTAPLLFADGTSVSFSFNPTFTGFFITFNGFCMTGGLALDPNQYCPSYTYNPTTTTTQAIQTITKPTTILSTATVISTATATVTKAVSTITAAPVPKTVVTTIALTLTV